MPAPIILISALARNHVIGTQNGMPWDVPEEYQQYLSFVSGQTVIMGRRTYEIFGADLTNTHAFVVSRSMSGGEGFEVYRSLEAALERGQELGKTIFVAGGGSIYAQALPLADAMYLSYIKGEFEGIAYFPDFDESDWKVVERKEEARFEFVHYQRKTT
ncbi:MAG: dihydrofolate reductase [Bacteroidota bacterium]